MKIFISWSGKDSISQKVADKLSKWLPMIIQSVEPWVSSDITSGDKWNEAINKNLSESKMGIICVTKENYRAPWLNFEAGAIAKGISSNKVIPLLINLKPSDLVDSPLIQFQAKSLDKESVKGLLLDINSLGEKCIPNDIITDLFEHLWDDFYKTIEEIISELPKEIGNNELEKKRPIEDILEEVLSLTREVRNELSYKPYNNTWYELLTNIDCKKRVNYLDELVQNDKSKLYWKTNLQKDINRDIVYLIINKGEANINSLVDYISKKYNMTKTESIKFLNQFLKMNDTNGKDENTEVREDNANVKNEVDDIRGENNEGTVENA